MTGERHGADFVAGLFAYQLKVRATVPGYLMTWLDGICQTAATSQRIGVVVLNQPHRPRRKALVILRWADWVALHGEPRDECGAPM